ncbi:hypothetical protein [Streptomyces hainanensis]|uniref:LPXTG cell wall anchor domain-containing protein n=1 Tax=Streptomyces hainanensis TaxID=402648 RepID=A0A4R4STN1_9ACTN|nr:hypothetical protein [Streptomyces hainanensis]TDC67457.1 hypothetical protein E1283_28865 [Streptomyces hainanensis]
MGIATPLKFTLCAATVTLAATGLVRAPDPEPPATGAELKVWPADARPGDEVELRVSGCGAGAAEASSEGFVAEATLAAAPGGELFGEARVRSTLEPGGYPVEVMCDGAPVAGRLTVVTDGQPAGQPLPSASGRPEPGERPEHPERPESPELPEPGGQHERPESPGHGERPEHPGRPSAPVGAGGGGTAGEPAPAGATTGPAGLALATGGLLAAGAVFAVRRLRRGAR